MPIKSDITVHNQATNGILIVTIKGNAISAKRNFAGTATDRMTEPSNSSEESRKIEGKTPHGELRSQEAQEGNFTRQVGDVNRVVREGRLLRDTETG